MLKQRFFVVVLAALSGIGLLIPASSAQAWGRWGYGGWGWGPSYGWYSSPYWGGYSWSYPYWGGYWPYGYSYYYPYSYSTYAPLYYSNAPAYAYDSSYSAPTRSFYYSPSTEDNNRVFLRVHVPSANARLWIEGREMSQGGTDRTFESPPIESGRYTYTIRASWQEGDRKRDQTDTVHVRPGQETSVKFGP